VLLVEDATRTVVLTTLMDADLQPSGQNDDTVANRRTRIRKWDHKGKILDKNGNELVDLDDAANLNDAARRGTIPVPAGATGVQVEAGILLRFDLEPNGGTFRVGDYWNFAARSAGGTFEKLHAAPPRGTHHHYTRLGIVTFPGPATDCRVIWPPPFGGEDCACTVCVSPEDHNSGSLTIQRALDQVHDKGGTVCLEPGDYVLGATPLRVRDVESVRIVGKGSKTILSYLGEGAALQLESGKDVDIRDITFAFASRGDIPAGGISLRNMLELVVDGCYFLELGDKRDRSTAIEVSGLIADACITRNVVLSANGLIARTSQSEEDYLIVADLEVSGNRFDCTERGIDLTGRAAFYDGDIRLDANMFRDCRTTAINAVLASANDDVPTPGKLRISRNLMVCRGNGIIAGATLLDISANAWRGLVREVPKTGGHGISLVSALDGLTIGDAQITDNTFLSVTENGVHVDTACGSLTISRNTLSFIQGSAIFFGNKASAGSVIIESNHMNQLCWEHDDRELPCCGVLLAGCEQARFSGNVVTNVASRAEHVPWFCGVEVLGCRNVRMEHNEIEGIGPPDFQGIGVGVAIGTFSEAAVSNNRITQFAAGQQPQGAGMWYGLGVVGGMAQLLKNYASRAFASGRSMYIGTKAGSVRVSALGGKLSALLDGVRMRIDENTVAGGGRRGDFGAELTLLSGTGECQFIGNTAELQRQTGLAAVQVNALVVQASNNRVTRTGEGVCLNIASRTFTILGNITMTKIQVNGSDITAPWADLNVI
jgi:hypothetical protein